MTLRSQLLLLGLLLSSCHVGDEPTPALIATFFRWQVSTEGSTTPLDRAQSVSNWRGVAVDLYANSAFGQPPAIESDLRRYEDGPSVLWAAHWTSRDLSAIKASSAPSQSFVDNGKPRPGTYLGIDVGPTGCVGSFGSADCPEVLFIAVDALTSPEAKLLAAEIDEEMDRLRQLTKHPSGDAGMADLQQAAD